MRTTLLLLLLCCCLGGVISVCRASALSPEKVTALSKSLKGADAKAQDTAAHQLAADGQTAPLLAALRTGDPRTRKLILSCMPRCMTPEVVAAVLPLVKKDPSAEVRLAAVQSLVGVRYHQQELVRRLSPQVDDALFAALKDTSLEVVRMAINLLPAQDARLEPALLDLLAHSSLPAIRSQVVGQLSRYSDTRVIAALRKVVNDPDTNVSAAAVGALGQSGNRKMAPVVLAVLKDPARKPEVVYNAGRALATLAAPDYLSPLLEIARKGRPLAQMGTLIALGGYSDPRAGQCLIAALKSPIPPLRAAASEALTQNHYRPAVLPLIAAAKAEHDARLRSAMLGTLAEMADPRAYDTFRGYLDAADTSLRLTAVGGLAALRDRRAVAPLLARLPKADESLHGAITRALAEIDDPHAVEPLIKALMTGLPDKTVPLASLQELDSAIRMLTGISFHPMPMDDSIPLRAGFRAVTRGAPIEFGHFTDILLTLYNESPNALVITGIRSLTDQGAEPMVLKSDVNAEKAGAGFTAVPAAHTPGMPARFISSGLLLPGQILQLKLPYRALTREEKLAISYLPAGKAYNGTPTALQAFGIYLPHAPASSDTAHTFEPFVEKSWRALCADNLRITAGEAFPPRSVLLTGEVAPIDCTISVTLYPTAAGSAGTIDEAREAAAKLSSRKAEELGITYSLALNGYVVADKDDRWVLKDIHKPERAPLPRVPLAFFAEADRGAVKIKLDKAPPAGSRLWNSYPILDEKTLQQPYLAITAKDLPAFLESVRANGATLTQDATPGIAHYQLNTTP